MSLIYFQAVIKTIHLPVIEDNGDTSGVVIGIPTTTNGVTNYLIIYQNNYNLVRDSYGRYYGQIQADLFNTSVSYSASANSNFELTSDTLVTGPLFINNPPCEGCRWVWPSWSCIDQTRDNFFAHCTGGCRFWCTVDDVVGFGSCQLGTYGGAAIWCARHNNVPQ